jgi:hypothetical protein
VRRPCATPCSCRAVRPSAICRTTDTNAVKGSRELSASVAPSTNSVTRYAMSPSTPKSWTSITLACRTPARTRAAFRKYSCRSGLIGRGYTATVLPDRMSSASITCLPRPRRRTSRYLPSTNPAAGFGGAPPSLRTLSSRTAANGSPPAVMLPGPGTATRKSPAATPARTSINAPTRERSSEVRPCAERGSVRSSSSRTPGRKAYEPAVPGTAIRAPLRITSARCCGWGFLSIAAWTRRITGNSGRPTAR